MTTRFLIPKSNFNNGKVKSSDEVLINKARNVLKLKVNDEIEIADGEGELHNAKIIELRRNRFVAEIIETSEAKEFSKPSITLAQALTRTTKIDTIIRMNTEIGVDKFIFFESDYSIVKIKDFNQKKIARWEKISQEATRQSERLNQPEIFEPRQLEEIVKLDGFDQMIALHSREDYTIGIEEIGGMAERSILIFIGPEGGFSPKEIEMFRKNNVKMVNLPIPILRTETAGIAISSYLNIRYSKIK